MPGTRARTAVSCAACAHDSTGPTVDEGCPPEPVAVLPCHSVAGLRQRRQRAAQSSTLQPVVGSPCGRPFQPQDAVKRSHSGSKPQTFAVSSGSELEVVGGTTPTGGGHAFAAGARVRALQAQRCAELQEEAQRRFGGQEAATPVEPTMRARGKSGTFDKAQAMAERMLDSLEKLFEAEDEAHKDDEEIADPTTPTKKEGTDAEGDWPDVARKGGVRRGARGVEWVYQVPPHAGAFEGVGYDPTPRRRSSHARRMGGPRSRERRKSSDRSEIGGRRGKSNRVGVCAHGLGAPHPH